MYTLPNHGATTTTTTAVKNRWGCDAASVIINTNSSSRTHTDLLDHLTKIELHRYWHVLHLVQIDGIVFTFHRADENQLEQIERCLLIIGRSTCMRGAV